MKKYKRIIFDFNNYLKANSIILHYNNLPSRMNCVNLHSYHPEYENGGKNNTYNLGDYLSSVIVNYMLKKKDLDINSSIKKKKNLYAVGSIIAMGFQNTTVWGSGLPYKLFNYSSFFHRRIYRKLDIRCVRGPLTRDELIKLGHKCPEKYADPVVLMPLIYSPNVTKTNKVVFIPHFETEIKERWN